MIGLWLLLCLENLPGPIPTLSSVALKSPPPHSHGLYMELRFVSRLESSLERIACLFGIAEQHSRSGHVEHGIGDIG
jgi:hypothetical protein